MVEPWHPQARLLDDLCDGVTYALVLDGLEPEVESFRAVGDDDSPGCVSFGIGGFGFAGFSFLHPPRRCV